MKAASGNRACQPLSVNGSELPCPRVEDDVRGGVEAMGAALTAQEVQTDADLQVVPLCVNQGFFCFQCCWVSAVSGLTGCLRCDGDVSSLTCLRGI